MIDRTIDDWKKQYLATTIKNTIAPLVRVLYEAVRDGLITVNPAKHRAKRSLHRNAFRVQPAEDAAPRAHAIPDLQKLNQLASACGAIHQSYSDFVMLAAPLAARSSEVSGLSKWRRGLQQKPRHHPTTGLPRQGRPHHQANQKPQGTSRADSRPTPAGPETTL